MKTTIKKKYTICKDKSINLPKNQENDDWWIEEMWKQPVEPYTMEEIKAMIDESERQIAIGQVQDFGEALDEIKTRIALKEKNKLEMSMSV